MFKYLIITEDMNLGGSNDEKVLELAKVDGHVIVNLEERKLWNYHNNEFEEPPEIFARERGTSDVDILNAALQEDTTVMIANDDKTMTVVADKGNA